MGKPAARINDMHVCPMVTPGTPPIPHVGGPITGPGFPTVLIGGMPAAVMGDMCVCTGPPDSIILGSTGVFIGGKPAVRMGDMTAHGGSIVVGCPTVLIGEAGGGGSAGGNKAGAKTAAAIANKESLENAAAEGNDSAERTDEEDYNAQFTLVDEAGKALAKIKYEIETPDGKKHKGKTDSSGKTKNLSNYTTSDCRISFLNMK